MGGSDFIEDGDSDHDSGFVCHMMNDAGNEVEVYPGHFVGRLHATVFFCSAMKLGTAHPWRDEVERGSLGLVATGFARGAAN